LAARVGKGIVLPPPVSPNHSIALWAPAFAPPKAADYQQAAAKWCQQYGWQCLLPTASPTHHAFAGTPHERLEQLQNILNRPNVGAIWAIRGGYGSYQLLPDFPIEQWREKRPWLIGFSDITALQLYLLKQGIASLHAPMPAVLAQTQTASLRYLAMFLQGKVPVYRTEAHPLQQEGEVEGSLIGGNLAVLCSLIGTPFMPDLRNQILFIEEVGEHSYAIDRLLHQLHYAFPLNHLRGLIVGSMSRSPDGETQEYIYRQIAEIVRQKAPGLPFCLGFPVGHEPHNYPMLQGGMVRLSIEAHSCTLSFLPQ
jgi:muramoyltetrapeptide carboxypeptidase